MIKRGLKQGFTIVELMVVVSVLAILAILVSVAYGNAQTQGRDVKIRDAADKFGDAIKLWTMRNNNTLPLGGSGSTVNNVNANTGCSDGANGYQAYMYRAAGYQCTVGDALVAGNYLPASLFTSLPTNTTTGNNGTVFMVYPCGGKNYLFYSLELPTSAETSAMTALSGSCASWGTITAAGMKAYKDITTY